MKKIIVTGASGFIGGYICKLLSDVPKTQLYACVRDEKSVIADPAIKVEINFLKEGFEQRLANIEPDIIIHTAALSQVDFCEQNRNEAWKVNVEATEKIALVAKEVGARLVFLSSDFVFSGKNEFETEESACSPVSFYGETKVAAESAIKRILDNYAIVRPVLVYGIPLNEGRNNIVTLVKRNLEQGKPMTIVDDQYRTPIYVEDLVDFLLILCSSKEIGIFHVGGAEYISVYEFTLKIARFFNLDVALLSPIKSKELAQKGVRPPKTRFDNMKVQTLFSFYPNSIDAGLLRITKQSFRSLK